MMERRGEERRGEERRGEEAERRGSRYSLSPAVLSLETFPFSPRELLCILAAVRVQQRMERVRLMLEERGSGEG